ncbi:unnamed protein product [Bursaphelenchus xylophilus]|uniref:glucuronosyltransferase n=1 Tax=Bursaphelenchus xylophilus TaxID=6326 RepID=A0A811KFX7_BURXY|nr:unnamed protein product [Bursaphelenchus xylophilus]CAG9094439.1 unnamed protein product [Bursaphelenchus xylophilus]
MRGFSVLLVFLPIIIVNGYKILLYSPNYSRSHINFIGQLANLYIEAGHEAVIIRPELTNNDPEVLINGSKARVVWSRKRFESTLQSQTMKAKAWESQSGGILSHMLQMATMIAQTSDAIGKMCQQLLSDEDLIDQLRKEKFDIGLLQVMDLCGNGLFERIGVRKFILAAAMPLPIDAAAILGIPHSLSFVPDMFPLSNEHSSFVRRAANIASFLFSKHFTLSSLRRAQIDAIRRYYPDFTIESAFGDASLVFANSDEHVEYPRPISHKIVYIGGFALSRPKPLVEPYKSLLDKAKNGVILVSFGSIAHSASMPKATKTAFLEAFRTFPNVKFIWKYEEPEDEEVKGLDNVSLAKWIPQTDVMNHKNAIGFITHGGMNSVSEASHFGIPMVCIPLFADQSRNCKMIQDRGIGLVASKANLTSETLISVFSELINNKKLYNKAKELAAMIKGKPMQPAERVLKYTEYAVKYDISKALELEGRHLSFVEFYNIDVYAAAVLSSLLSVYLVCRAVRCCVSALLLIAASNGFKILLYSPNYSRSHINFIGKLADIYHDAGHEVAVFRPHLFDNDPDFLLNGTKARVIAVKKKFETPLSPEMMRSNSWTMGNDGIVQTIAQGYKMMKLFGDGNTKLCRQILGDDEIIETLKSEKFDIGLIQIFDICGAGLFKKIGLEKYILAAAMPLPISVAASLGVPYSLSFVPDYIPLPTNYGSFVKRTTNVVAFLVVKHIMSRAFQGYQTVIVQEHFPDFTVDGAFANASLVFVNSDEHVEFPRPISHKIVYIGGFALSQPKPLIEPYKSYLDDSKDGAVLVSFGSIAQSSSMPDETKQAFLDAFKAFPNVRFIWKYETPEDDIAKGLENVLVAKWVPQTDILNHKNLIGFVTHGGMNSVSEASHFGIPMVCIFLFGDQLRNCRMVEDRGLGISAHKAELTSENLIKTFSELINDKKYYKKAKSIARMIKGKPLQPVDRVLQYTEYAADYDIAEVLELEGRHLNIVQFYNIDVLDMAGGPGRAENRGPARGPEEVGPASAPFKFSRPGPARPLGAGPGRSRQGAEL